MNLPVTLVSLFVKKYLIVPVGLEPSTSGSEVSSLIDLAKEILPCHNGLRLPIYL